MKKNDVLMWLAIAGGAYAVYWYLTKNGPNGPVFNDQGQQIAPSYWDSWFGGEAAAPAQTQVPQVPVQAGTSVTYTKPAGSNGAAPTDVRTRLLTATGGVNSLNADQWNYYRNALFPPALTVEQFVMAFPVRTDPMPMMTVDQFLGALTAAGLNPASPGMAGLGAIVPVPSVSSIPSMSFGGSLRNPIPSSPSAFRGGGGRGNRGGYLQ